MTKRNDIPKFIWRITYSHFTAYFLAGIFALTFLDYKELFATEKLALLMRPVSDPIVALGPLLQFFRGILIALILLPIRKVITEQKNGFFIMGWLILGLSLLSTIGPTSGSFEGYIYTTIPAAYQALGYIEGLLYIVLLVFMMWVSYRYEKKWLNILFIIIVLIICSFSLMGYFQALHLNSGVTLE